ncbi:hypothetical protein TBLA_0C03460 [Henningerozyma blattae CBS 6284]|uniref:CRIB domain-containing protein n=1 Tax=Henningerozyma blattae (strain ATCC 34711 / CBS 6284 / DSM 70876 / NBRC 10599 / NRRL Y-10934 / UCD 77-7) TaxID=1071380 RepID=I2H197_HENB6|nr:hypothetical protein TBLA_0C03460 [Tetrapisispora blattae CBS 6284]CCH60149.1 hypothetical protein TBLA_0C03460 [Tetrapisispora blattae CBS 6284]
MHGKSPVQVNMENLPQMKSIWLDEDQEAEKLYGLQTQQFMNSGTEDDNGMAIMTVNSNKPLLNNKKNIRLPPLVKQRVYVPLNNHDAKFSKKKKFLGLFNLKDIQSHQKHSDKSTSPLGNRNISGPYQFQHISHCALSTNKTKQDDSMRGAERIPSPERENQNTTQSQHTLLLHTLPPPFQDLEKKQSASSSIYSSQEVELDEPQSKNIQENFMRSSESAGHTRSRSLEPSKPPTILEELLNKQANTDFIISEENKTHSISSQSGFEITPGSTRIKSTSSMATSIGDISFSPSTVGIDRMNTLEKFRMARKKGHSRNNSASSNEINVDFLKNYDFPTLLEDKEILKFSSSVNNITLKNQSQTTISMGHTESPQISSLSRLRRNSDSLLITTPKTEIHCFEGTPGSRKSLDDILLCYFNDEDSNNPSPSKVTDSVMLSAKLYQKEFPMESSKLGQKECTINSTDIAQKEFQFEI